MPDEPAVGIVVVSHSAAVAEATVELVRQLANLDADGPRLVAAGGMADGAIGTDAARIADAVGQADAGAGVVVLADLGGAVLSAQPRPRRAAAGRGRGARSLSGGPLVEGTFIAAVQASAGDTVDGVRSAADEAATMSKLGDAGCTWPLGAVAHRAALATSLGRCRSA